MDLAGPPTAAELLERAEQALADAGGAGVATAGWERKLTASPGGAGEDIELRVEVTELPAGAPSAPRSGRAHAGYDPLLTRLEPEELAAAGGEWRAGAARTAIVSSAGARAFEQRSFAAVRLGPLGWAAVTPAGIDLAALAVEAAALETEAAPADPPEGELEVVLGPDAVAAVLDRLRPELASGGALAGRLGTRVAASTVALSDSPRYATTLPRSYDASGTPRQPVPLLQDGVAHRVVSPATGHADGAEGARAEHLVLVGGGAASVEELMAPIERGVYLPSLALGFLVEGGRRGAAIDVRALALDPLAVLASVQALTSRQRTFAVGDSPRTVGATVCPALRAAAGVVFGGAG